MWGNSENTIIIECLTPMICDHNNDCSHQNLEKPVICIIIDHNDIMFLQI